MKKSITLFLILFLSFQITSFTTHKFYIGVYQVDYKSDKKEIQITSRVFIDDIEKAIEAKFKKKLNLSTSKESKESNELIEAYFKEKFKCTINNKSQELSFLAKEYEDDVMICYHKVGVSNKLKSLNIYNSILTELYSEQQNLLHTNINSNKKSYLFTNSNTTEKIEF